MVQNKPQTGKILQGNILITFSSKELAIEASLFAIYFDPLEIESQTINIFSDKKQSDNLCNILMQHRRRKIGGGGGGAGPPNNLRGAGQHILCPPPIPNNPPTFSSNFYVKQ